MAKPVIHWSDLDAAASGLVDASQPPFTIEPALAPRDRLVFLLHTAAEVEHSLMVQYLYAWLSLRTEDDDPTRDATLKDWGRTLLEIAREEMGHLATVLNLLRAVGGPLNLEREDYPFRSDLYPFPFQLEPLSRASLARYLLAERPSDVAPDLLKRLTEDAGMPGEIGAFKRVGALFTYLIELLGDPEIALLSDTLPLQASAADWGLGFDGMEVHAVVSTPAAIAALERIAAQGEGDGSPDGGRAHYERFLAIYEAWPDGWSPARALPTNPSTLRSDGDVTPIVHGEARAWARLFDLRYRMLLFDIAHAMSAGADAKPPRDRAFMEMRHVAAIGHHLVTLPASDEAGAGVAGPPFELPYTLAVPDLEMDRLRTRRDLVDASLLLLDEVSDAGPRERLRRYDTSLRQSLDALIPRPMRGLFSLHVLPPLAIGRLGSAESPMDNYEIDERDGGQVAALRPAETLRVDRATGRITDVFVPDAVRFTVGKQVRPVAPFLEVWAQLVPGGDLVPLRRDHLEELGAELTWRVRFSNHKIYRRTRNEDDRIDADTGEFRDHEIHPLEGSCANFVDGRTLPMGSVQYLAPTDAHPEIRLRFTPAAGKVYGAQAASFLAGALYRPDGPWVGYEEERDSVRTTQPGGIFARAEDRSRGFLDDTGDGIVRVRVVTKDGTAHTAMARISSGPPDFAPDSVPVRSVDDELRQLAFGLDSSEGSTTERLGAVIQLVKRALDNVRLMHTDSMNRAGMSSHDAGVGIRRTREPIYRPEARAAYRTVLTLHRRVVRTLEQWRDAPSDASRQAATGSLEQMVRLLRRPEDVGDLSDDQRRRMPALMRGADGRHLALTLRNLRLVEGVLDDLRASAQPQTPREAMIALVERYRGNALRHAEVAVGASTLDTLFDNPPALLAYLKREVVKGDRLPAVKGQRLVTPGDPTASALMTLIETPQHPMGERFTDADREVVRTWIRSLADDGGTP